MPPARGTTQMFWAYANTIWESLTDGIRSINRSGIEDENGVQHDVDVIVYATGFRATEYLYPMAITGRDICTRAPTSAKMASVFDSATEP